jgi:hypothetical protein
MYGWPPKEGPPIGTYKNCIRPCQEAAPHLVGCRAVVGVVVTAGELSKESIQCNRSVA